MSTQVDQEPILEIDGEKHIISQLSDDAKLLVNRLQLNEDELIKAQNEYVQMICKTVNDNLKKKEKGTLEEFI